MTFSLCLSLVNYIHYGSRLDIYANFVPSIIFLLSIFGYLVVCVIYKWSVDWYARGEAPPSLLNMLIYMFLSPTTLEDPLYPGQKHVQNLLLLLALICVPWLLLMKPLYLQWENSRAQKGGYTGLLDHDARISHEDAGDEDGADGAGASSGVVIAEMDNNEQEHEGFEFSEVMIHQVIHTIEFCLNCVSHTASYLRLWGTLRGQSHKSNCSVEFGTQSAFLCIVEYDARKCVRDDRDRRSLIFGCGFCDVACSHGRCVSGHGGNKCHATCTKIALG
jgi:V-type H+-transporting ATPase subunit a